MIRLSLSGRALLARVLLAATLLACGGCGARADGKLRVRAGHFPNITHAQGVLGHATGRFQQALGERATVEWKVFNAGPSAIEAIFAGDLDLTYIGPNPAVNGHVRSHGEALRIVAGGCSGGAGLVVRAWVAEHVRITDWINANRDEAARLVNEEIRRETGAALPASILQPAFARLELTDDPVPASLVTSARQAHELGFLGRGRVDLAGIYDLRFLNEARAAAHKAPVTP